jgi:hypothetical protein
MPTGLRGGFLHSTENTAAAKSRIEKRKLLASYSVTFVL